MAVKTIADLLVDANVIKNATIPGENTATRVGDNLVDIIDSLAGGNYTTYTVFLSQTGTGDPTVTTVCANTIGSISWARTDIGTYEGTLASAFPSGKRWAMAVGDSVAGGFPQIGFSDDSTILLYNYLGGSLDDDFAMYIEIRVYP